MRIEDPRSKQIDPRPKREIRDSRHSKYVFGKIAKYERALEEGGAPLYSRDELRALEEAGVSDRLAPRATSYYMELACRSEAIRNLIKARPNEVEDLSGENDPSNQLRYSPVPGVLHKYELVLLYVVRTCSSFCRYCYRSDFLSKNNEKEVADPATALPYIREHNERARTAGAGIGTKQTAVPIREVLLSGGDPMVLSNRRLYEWLCGLAEAGVQTIRIGTKELAFFPARFDAPFFEMIDLFHEQHPRVNLVFMVHFSHPDELLALTPEGDYVQRANGSYKLNPLVARSIAGLRRRAYISLENQTPIIADVNDDAAALHLLQRELRRLGVHNHYFFQCREIEGHKVFSVPLESTFELHRESQIGLSGVEKSRLAMSTEQGKIEIVGLIRKPDWRRLGRKLPWSLRRLLKRVIGDGLIIMKLHRTPYAEGLAAHHGELIVARRNPEALWISGYEDRLLYDGRAPAGQKYAPLAAIFESLGSLTDLPAFTEPPAAPEAQAEPVRQPLRGFIKRLRRRSPSA